MTCRMTYSRFVPALLFTAWTLSACALGPLGAENTVGASVSGVNYTDQDITYLLFDPSAGKDEKGRDKVVASEMIGPYSAGGILCCYPLPKTWHPGLQAGVLLDVFDAKTRDYLPRQRFIVDIPRYEQAADVWFINYPDGTVGVVSTAYRPNGEGWPGKIKGWPKPSIEYQRQRWQLYMDDALSSLRLYTKNVETLRTDPQKHLQRRWNYLLDREKNAPGPPPEELKKFSGPDDPKFLAYEREQNEKYLKQSQDKVDYLQKIKP